MKHNHYRVTFVNGQSIEITAFNMNEARILAQAQAIKNAWDYVIMTIIDLD